MLTNTHDNKPSAALSASSDVVVLSPAWSRLLSRMLSRAEAVAATAQERAVCEIVGDWLSDALRHGDATVGEAIEAGDRLGAVLEKAYPTTKGN